MPWLFWFAAYNYTIDTSLILGREFKYTIRYVNFNFSFRFLGLVCKPFSILLKVSFTTRPPKNKKIKNSNAYYENPINGK